MRKINNPQELKQAQEIYKNSLDMQYRKVLICAGTGCVAGGSMDIYNAIGEMLEERGLPFSVELAEEPHGEEIGLKQSGCHGFCEMGPLLRIEPEGWLYLKVKLEDCEEIIEKTLIEGQPIERLMYKKDGKIYQSQEEIQIGRAHV